MAASEKHGLVIADGYHIIILKEPRQHSLTLDQNLQISYAHIYGQHGERREIYNLSEGLTLTPGDYAFDIYFSNADRSPLSRAIPARYKLEGWDSLWIDAHEPLVRYSGLTPGQYTLKLANSSHPDIQHHIEITVEAPFWRNQWALALYFISIASLIGLLIFVRRAQLRGERAAQNLIDIYAKGYDKIGDGFCILNREGKINSFNKAFAKITGIEQDCDDIYISQFRSPKEIDGGYRDFWDCLLNDGYWQGQLWLSNHKGEDIPVECKASTVEHESKQHYIVVIKDITQKLAHEAELKRMATFDELTGMPNRNLFNEELRRIIAGARRRKNGKFCLLFIDLDRFKQINDSLGHDVGDELLIQMAKRLKQSVRRRGSDRPLRGR